MVTNFTDWNGSNKLQHYGIPGMKWGVRKYQNADGSLTAAGERRYGSTSVKATSARKMQRDFNNLDEGFANVVAENRAATKHRNKVAMKIMARAAKATKQDPEKVRDFLDNDKKVQKLGAKMKKDTQKIALTEQRMKNIENLQWRILEKANAAGYTTTSKQVMRAANTGKQKALAILAGATVGGGAIPGAIIGTALGASATMVKGQRVKIRKRGDGSTRIAGYQQG